MVSVPMSAFEMYSRQKKKRNKAKDGKAKTKNKEKMKVTPMVAAELRKVASDVKKSSGAASEPERKVVTDVQKAKPIVSGALVDKPEAVPAHVEEPMVTVVKASSVKGKKTKSDGLADNAAKSNNRVTNLEKAKKAHVQSAPKSSAPSKEHPNSKSVKKQTNLKFVSEKEEGNSKSVKKPRSSGVAEPSSAHLESSIETAEKFFSWMMDPITKDDFLSMYWEKRPVHISREGSREYYESILSTSAIDDMLRKNNILYGKNVDITSYVNGVRATLNSVGRAHAAVVWDYYRNGCSVRLLNPQTYHARLRELNTRLQEVFGSFVGSNAYLTPPNSQGFAPHYDDIEAFVLQVEGSKMWRIYAPRDPMEKLPRKSSPNFSQEEIGEPILEVHLKAGDLLYFPRGFIHQATTVEGEHSLHVTVSTYQRNSWADLLEKMIPVALANAIEEDVEFRKGMPLDVMNHIGAVHSESTAPEREAIMKKLSKLCSKLFEYAPVDAAADQLAKDYVHEFLPPCLSSDEKKCSVLMNSERMASNGQLQGSVAWTPDTRIRLTRSNVLRMVSEEEPDTMKIYHSMENSLEYRGEEPQCIEIPLNMAEAVEELIHAYPNFIAVSDLSLNEEVDKLQIATELWERGLVLTEKPLPQVDDTDDDDISDD